MADQPLGLEGAEEALQRSSALFLTELDRLRDLEARKAAMAPDDSRRVAFAHEIEDLTLDLMRLGRYQTRLIELQKHTLGGADVLPRPPRVIIELWREAERKLGEARAAFEHASDEAERLHEEHRRTVRT